MYFLNWCLGIKYLYAKEFLKRDYIENRNQIKTQALAVHPLGTN